MCRAKAALVTIDAVPVSSFHPTGSASDSLDSRRVLEQTWNAEQRGNVMVCLFKEVLSLAALSAFVLSFSLIIHAI